MSPSWKDQDNKKKIFFNSFQAYFVGFVKRILETNSSHLIRPIIDFMADRYRATRRLSHLPKGHGQQDLLIHIDIYFHQCLHVNRRKMSILLRFSKILRALSLHEFVFSIAAYILCLEAL